MTTSTSYLIIPSSWHYPTSLWYKTWYIWIIIYFACKKGGFSKMPATSCFCQQDMWIGMKYSQMWQKGAVVRERLVIMKLLAPWPVYLHTNTGQYTYTGQYFGPWKIAHSAGRRCNWSVCSFSRFLSLLFGFLTRGQPTLYWMVCTLAAVQKKSWNSFLSH